MDPVLTVYVTTPDKSMTFARSRQEVYDLDRQVGRLCFGCTFANSSFVRFSYDRTSLIASRHYNNPPYRHRRRNGPSSPQSPKHSRLVDHRLPPAPRNRRPSNQSISLTSLATSPTPRPTRASDHIPPGKHSSRSDSTIWNRFEWSDGLSGLGARSFSSARSDRP